MIVGCFAWWFYIQIKVNIWSYSVTTNSSVWCEPQTWIIFSILPIPNLTLIIHHYGGKLFVGPIIYSVRRQWGRAFCSWMVSAYSHVYPSMLEESYRLRLNHFYKLPLGIITNCFHCGIRTVLNPSEIYRSVYSVELRIPFWDCWSYSFAIIGILHVLSLGSCLNSCRSSLSLLRLRWIMATVNSTGYCAFSF